MKLDEGHIDYVLFSLKNNSTDVRNIQNYLITALYNAPNTIDSYYTSRVNHDMRVSEVGGPSEAAQILGITRADNDCACAIYSTFLFQF